MDKIVKLKFLAIIIYAISASILFYDDHFIQNSTVMHQYGHVPFMIAVLCLGVILSAAVYNLAFYFYIRNRQYLYYALAQLFILSTLVGVESMLISPFDEIYGFKNYYILDISQTFMLIFSMLFIQAFFQTYNTDKLNNLINIIIKIALFDLVLSLFFGHTIITKFVPTFIWVWFVLSEAHRHIKKKDAPFYFVSVGWHIVIVIILLEYLYIIDPHKVGFPFLHVVFALESMLLSFALSYKFKLVEDEQKAQQTMLLQQSRLASMGEMISIIAHQWRQPLNFLSYSFMHIKQNCKNDDDALMTIKEANEQLQYMSQTIESFRNFYNPSKERADFSIKESCENAIQIVTPTLNATNIKLNLDVWQDFSYYANANEFEQVLLNIVNNARDVLVERLTPNPTIDIKVNEPTITITDNAGGISKENIEKIFDPYFSTKRNSDGIGLYIGKTIIEREMSGKLEVSVKDGKTIFTITLQKK
ncbi:MAG: sensor histidine kinase [Epsilonproteobacteria bacterium]|nr:sensor histidine kinase [Campylobacterota bacterium]